MSTKTIAKKNFFDITTLIIVFALGVTVSYLAVTHINHTFINKKAVGQGLTQNQEVALGNTDTPTNNGVILADQGCGCPSCCSVSKVL